jgi:hypothetical protein
MAWLRHAPPKERRTMPFKNWISGWSDMQIPRLRCGMTEVKGVGEAVKRCVSARHACSGPVWQDMLRSGRRFMGLPFGSSGEIAMGREESSRFKAKQEVWGAVIKTISS